MTSIILDLFGHSWHKTAKVFSDDTEFWKCVWSSQQCLIVVDDGSATVKRDRQLIPVFTTMRHLQHELAVIGHSGTNLLPEMREQLDTLYLFRQTEKAAKIWVETFTDERLMQATTLQQYEFIHKVKEEMAIQPQTLFQPLYQIFLTRDDGPQAGWFLSTLDRQKVLDAIINHSK